MSREIGPGRSPAAALARFWADDKGLSVFCLVLFGLVFIVPLLAAPGSGRSLPGDVAFALLLLSGVKALSARRSVFVLMPVALLTIAVDLGSWFFRVPPAWGHGMGLVAVLLLVVVVLGQTLRDGPVTHHRILGAVAAYLLLGVLWAHAYALTATLRPGAFSGPVDSADGPRGFVYFSFVTLTSTGYGDVLPVHPAARTLANLEAVTGTLYLAILVARLVSLAVAPGRSPGGPSD